MTNVEDLHQRVEKALDSIRPYLQTDGGNVKILEINEKHELKLELLGACGNCPMSTMTLKAGVEEAVKREVPEIISVEAINITSYHDPNAQLPNRML